MLRTVLPSCLLSCLALAAAVAAQDPAPLTLARRNFDVLLELQGSFAPAGAAEIQLWPEEYSGDWTFLEVLRHGSYLNAGDVIARFDRRRYEEQWHQAELDLRSAELGQQAERERARLEEERAQEEMDNAKAALERARKDLKGWEEFELKFRQRQQELSEASTEDGLADQMDELAQLEAMYSGDELVDATEELVIRRNRRQLARSQQYAELNRERRLYNDEYETAVQTAIKREALGNQERAFARMQVNQELDRAARQDRLARSADAFGRQKERLEALRADGALFEIKAPRAGLLLHGAPGDYEPGKSPPRHERAASGGTRRTLFTVADPDRLQVVLAVDEADLPRVRDNMAAKVMAPAAPGSTWIGALDLRRFPEPGQNRYRGVVQFEQPMRGLVPGMKAEVQVAAETMQGVFVVPERAVFGPGVLYLTGPGGEARRVEVKSLASYRGEVVVEGALQDGDRVLLAEPKP